MKQSKRTQKRIRRALALFGWGPRSPQLGETVFYRNPWGWQLGNGTVCRVWHGGRVPRSALRALRAIERDHEAMMRSVGRSPK